jgi:predicted permease
MRAIWNRLIGLFRRDRIDRDVEEELALHAQLTQEALERDGLAARDAQAAARRRVGNTLQLRERSQDAWRIQPLDTLMQDARQALRLLRRHTTYSVPALGTLALGIGLNTAIFSIVYGVLLKPLPYRDPERLVYVTGSVANSPERPAVSWSPPDYQAMREERSALESLAAHVGTMVALTGRGGPLQLQAMDVTPNFFDVLGVSGVQGRTFAYTATPSTASAYGGLTAEIRVAETDERSVVIGDRLWRTAFGADPALLGQTITIGGEPRTVIGIMPAGFDFRTSNFNPPTVVDAWLPNAYNGGNRGNAFLQLIGRLRPGVSLAQADAAVNATAHHVTDARFPLSAGVISLHEHIVGPVRRLLLVFLGAVGFVLLIACVNVANLQLARLAARRSELSVRAELGAGRRRLARQLLTESVILALAGGALGAGLAYIVVRALVSMLPEGQLTRTTEIGVSLPVLAFCLALSLLTGLVFGSLPAWTMADADPNELRAGALRTTSNRATLRTRSALVSVQIALTLVLVIGGALLARSFVSLLRIDPGFDTTDVLTANVWLPEERYPTPERLHQFSQRVRDQLRALPDGGVHAASAVNFPPFGSTFYVTGDFAVDGQPKPRFYVTKMKAESQYFATSGIPMQQGRDFTDRDAAGAPLVAIVSASVAKRLWPDGSAIGRRVSADNTEWLTVVGVAADTRHMNLQLPPPTVLYVPYQQEQRDFFLRPLSLVIRTSTPEATAAAVRRIVSSVDPDLPIAKIATVQDSVSRSVAEPRFRSTVLVTFALSALAIATLGVYGLLAYTIAQRRREMGIRLAMGAAPPQIVGLVLRGVLKPVFAGLLMGLVAAATVTSALQSFLFGVTATDPVTMAGATMLLGLVALAAVWVPARRAARIDPLETLRAE